MEFSSNMFSLVAMVFAIGIVGAVAVDISAILQKVEAKGCNNEIGINASRTRCIH